MRRLGWLLLFVALSARAEVSLPLAQNIKNQGCYPYCTFFAMSTFLELWGGKGAQALPPLDTGFLAMSYNHDIGSGNRGVWSEWLMGIVQSRGVVPEGAVPKDTAGVKSDWAHRHLALVPVEELAPLIKATFTHPSVSVPFTASEYLRHIVQIDFRRFKYLKSDYEETYRPIEEQDDLGPAQYRHGNASAADKAVDEYLARAGLPRVKDEVVGHAELYRLLVAQLYSKRPALVEILPTLTREEFADYAVISAADLVATGEGTHDSHAAVVVGHCDKPRTRDPLCSRFSAEMRRRGIKECVVVQNSWGSKAHEGGYTCISRKAMKRVLLAALILKSFVAPPTRLKAVKSVDCAHAVAAFP